MTNETKSDVQREVLPDWYVVASTEVTPGLNGESTKRVRRYDVFRREGPFEFVATFDNERNANAAGAAPAMLAALKALKAAPANDHAQQLAAWRMAHAAIAKAEGCE